MVVRRLHRPVCCRATLQKRSGHAGRCTHVGLMGRKKELRDVDWVAQEAALTAEERLLFGEYLHDCKSKGDFGTKNDRGDFTRDELRSKAQEFKELRK